MNVSVVTIDPQRINGEVDKNDVSVCGKDIPTRPFPTGYSSASLHFRDYHIYMNPTFSYVPSQGLVWPDQVSFDYVKRNHKVHIFISRMIEDQSNGIGPLSRFLNEVLIRTGKKVVVHVFRDISAEKESASGKRLPDELCFRMVLAINQAHSLYHMGRKYSKFVCPICMIRETDKRVVSFRLKTDGSSRDNLLRVGFDKNRHVIYRFAKHELSKPMPNPDKARRYAPRKRKLHLMPMTSTELGHPIISSFRNCIVMGNTCFAEGFEVLARNAMGQEIKGSRRLIQCKDSSKTPMIVGRGHRVHMFFTKPDTISGIEHGVVTFITAIYKISQQRIIIHTNDGGIYLAVKQTLEHSGITDKICRVYLEKDGTMTTFRYSNSAFPFIGIKYGSNGNISYQYFKGVWKE